MAAIFSDGWARGIIVAAWLRVFGTPPTDVEAQGVQAVAHLETAYGRLAQGAHNWGNVHCSSSSGGTPGTDTDAKGKSYATCFANYADDVAGAAALIRTMVRPNVKRALHTGSATRVARAMHTNKYFELEPDQYAERLETRARSIATSLGEPVYFQRTSIVLGGTVLLSIAGAVTFAYRRGVLSRLG